VADAPLGQDEIARLIGMVARADVLVQPFIEAVPRDGEMSFVFIEGEFSHAVRKRAAPGDFRVQTEHGGSVAREPVNDRQVRIAAAVLALAPEPTLYARVDAVLSGEEFLLMELEVVEPDLFFEAAPEAADTLAAAIERRVLTQAVER
jgi:glutathione synthase/RimK-type ligase-like ATP-grasp enzyme